MKYLSELRSKSVPSNTILMVETAVYLEDTRRTTIDLEVH
jgi:hypothetical protein